MTDHGTASCYRRRQCRRPECVRAHKIANARYKAARARRGAVEKHGRGLVGGRLTVDATRTRAEVDDLRRVPLTLVRIAELSGVNLRTVHSVVYRRHPTVRVATAERIHGMWFDYFGDRRRERIVL